MGCAEAQSDQPATVCASPASLRRRPESEKTTNRVYRAFIDYLLKQSSFYLAKQQQYLVFNQVNDTGDSQSRLTVRLTQASAVIDTQHKNTVCFRCKQLTVSVHERMKTNDEEPTHTHTHSGKTHKNIMKTHQHLC